MQAMPLMYQTSKFSNIVHIEYGGLPWGLCGFLGAVAYCHWSLSQDYSTAYHWPGKRSEFKIQNGFC
jgi:hypothetical protein